MRKIVAAVGMIAVSAVVTASSTARVGFTGMGKARIGLSEQALAKALGTPLIHGDLDAEEKGCYYASASGIPAGASLMIIDGRLARVDVTEAGIETISGAQVGMSEHAVAAIYGSRLKQTPHAYTGPEGHYLTIRSPDGRHGVRFETDGKVVTRFYAGTAAAVEYIEGCQ